MTDYEGLCLNEDLDGFTPPQPYDDELYTYFNCRDCGNHRFQVVFDLIKQIRRPKIAHQVIEGQAEPEDSDVVKALDAVIAAIGDGNAMAIEGIVDLWKKMQGEESITYFLLGEQWVDLYTDGMAPAECVRTMDNCADIQAIPDSTKPADAAERLDGYFGFCTITEEEYNAFAQANDEWVKRNPST
jgi:hypothetical protein